MNKLLVKNINISITGLFNNDFISMTDIARFKNDYDPNSVIANWMRSIDTLQFLQLWERLNNNNFKPTDFEGFKSKPGENAFTMSPKRWIEITGAIGIKVKAGRYNGGTFAHKDISLEFAAWISPKIKLYIIKEKIYPKWIDSYGLQSDKPCSVEGDNLSKLALARFASICLTNFPYQYLGFSLAGFTNVSLC